ncbi:MAG: N-acetyl sugar amidotransferase [Candidatus Omnitrophota bacterium]
MVKKDLGKLYNLPVEVKYCKRCVISNQRPRIVFDEKGVCNACNFAEKKRATIDWKRREKELRDLCDRYRRNDGSFDVIVPSSGGKDSAITAHQLKFTHNMHPLTVTWAPHIYTDIGWDNFQGLIKSGLPNILGTQDGKVHSRLSRDCFIEMGEPFQPFIYGQVSFPLQMAVKYKVPLIMDGENGETEYGGDEKCEKMGFSLEDEMKYWFSNKSIDWWLKKGYTKKDLYMYFPPSVKEISEQKIERHFYSYYKNWLPQEHYYYAAEHTNFKANPDGRSEGTYSKYASLDDRIDGFHYYLMFVKFGIGRATSDAAHEVRDRHLTREEAVALVRKYDGEFPRKYFGDFLSYCDITEELFWEVVDSWRSPRLWERVNGAWRLKYQVT